MHALRACLALWTLAALTLASRTHAQKIPNSNPDTVRIHPERRLTLKAPEKLYSHDVTGSDDVVVLQNENTLYVQATIAFLPPMVAVLHVIGDSHEWTVILKAVANQDDVRETIELVVAPPPELAPAAVALPEPKAQPAVQAADDSYPITWSALTGRGYLWLATSKDPGYVRASQTTLGVRISKRVHALLTTTLDLHVTWADEHLLLERPDRDHSLRPLWLQGALHLRLKQRGRMSIAPIVGLGARVREAGELLDLRETPALDGLTGGAFAVLGVGLERRFGDGIFGVDVVGEAGGPDEQWSLSVLFTLGCLPKCEGG